ncbi:hypothetical protein METBIDRAFT_9429 [Metschnikowia bicuspidata var. bicuspidata NRRL YB-4993]|uniref:Suf-domain-containing protein n=1 Tax=Metschnikowia bicuspidata var. bicuspidata NRRL YB-4993 TaxID=869754 RepID=A0A1A0HGZ7_9ASCO|nr:hypothetical protein METBIDRAFT_9429 [Metschnikowia bicuspidata var. bicuspidata NRRL YB-4993]OBA23123.1 hypothetical protein METBIDRAFT_9429 [Metschnikowia bicuspidata var. bicuspidata NRRL YB-4993]
MMIDYILRPRPEKWDQAKAAALADKDNWRKWDALFQQLEAAWTAAASKDAAAAAHEATKAAFSVFLLRFPYLAAHWRQYLLLLYRMGGVDASVACLKQAVAAHPRSVLLWVEYLAALQSVQGGRPDGAPARPDSSDAVRAEFARAAAAVGMDFNADPFWDKYIAFEAAAGVPAPSPRLLEVYLRVLRVPLYQYAQYYSQFGEISRNYAAADILGEADRARYLEAFGKTLLEELSVVEQRQLVDTYCHDIFTQTQAHVARKWPYEAALAQALALAEALAPALGLAEAVAPARDWAAYLAAESAVLEAMPAGSQRQLQYALVVSVYERALVAHCADGGLWARYADFVAEHAPSPQQSFQARDDIYRRAIHRFVPVAEPALRERYTRMLAAEQGFGAAAAFLGDALRTYAGVAGARLYGKDAYVHTLAQTLLLWAAHVPPADVVRALEGLVGAYFSGAARHKRDAVTKAARDDGTLARAAKTEQPARTGSTPANSARTETSPAQPARTETSPAQPARTETSPANSSKSEQLSPSHISAVSRCLNDDGVCVVAVHLLRLLRDEPAATERIRSFYNKHHAEHAFSRSVQFWRFFVDFEGAGHRNLANLRSVVRFVSSATALPKTAVDALLDIYYELTGANLAQAVSLLGKENYLDILLNIRMDKSDDLHVNRPAQRRLAMNNYLLPDPKPAHAHAPADALMKLRARHAGHPGVFVDARPGMTHRIMDGPWVSLLDDKLEPPVFPTLRNVDKANAPINYPEE